MTVLSSLNYMLRRLRFESLALRLPLAVVANGGFDVDDSAEPSFGWELSAPVSVESGRAVIREDAASRSFLEQSFLLPAGATELEFDLESLTLDWSPSQPPDTLEIALLDAATLLPIVPALDGVNDADAFASFNADDRVYFGSQTSITGIGNSGDQVNLNLPLTVSLDVSSIAEDVQALLVFELLGFGNVTAEAVIDNVRVDGNLPPDFTLQLLEADDSGVVGDGITNVDLVTLRGIAEPGQAVTLDVDNDGFDDGTATADASGEFRFEDVSLTERLDVRVRGENTFGTTIVSRPFQLDAQSPTGALSSPTADSVVTSELGFVDIRWTDSVAGVDPESIGIDDVSISGVTVDRTEVLSDGIVRYHFADDDDELPYGPIRVELVDEAVTDLAGNLSVSSESRFLRLDAGCPWHNTALPTDVNTSGFASPLDALIVINEIARRQADARALDLGPAPPAFEEVSLYDVNCDGRVTPLDALVVINFLARQNQ
ncbi:MAG: dockerin type I domain-containing protein [Planctomycetota bacterium]